MELSELERRPDNQELFLKELAALTARYGIGICGCGCCGSPWLTKEEPGGIYEICEIGDRLIYYHPDPKENEE